MVKLWVSKLFYLLSFTNLTSGQIYKLRGSTVVFTCQFNGNFPAWSYRSSTSGDWTVYTFNGDIANVPAKSRISITGDLSSGEYNLNIRDLHENDSGYYTCIISDGVIVVSYQVIVIVGPTSVQIIAKTQDNKIEGTEGHNLEIHCTATGGSPQPDVKLLIEGTKAYIEKQSVTYTIQTLNRGQDGQNVTCQAGYTSISDFPLIDSARLYLSLKPFAPTFNQLSVSVIEGHSFESMCTSTSSRPAAVFNWDINGANITDSSVITSRTLDKSTYTVISRLRLTLNKEHNGQHLTCKAINIAAPNGVPAVPITVDVKYAPVVKVRDRTFPLTQTSREIQCVVDGNPVSSFSRWQHRSKSGELIRELDGRSTLILPQQPEDIRYQDTGEYTCRVSNGIRDQDGNLNQNGSGYIVSQAPTQFMNGYSQTRFGQFGKDIDIDVYVYSQPKYSTPIWLKDGRPLPQSNKYTMLDVSDVMTDTFYSTKVQIDGFRLTLTIKNLEKYDFLNYTLRLSNGVGGTVEHLVVLLDASPPDTPAYFTITSSTVSTIILHWLPALNGGYGLTFYVEYRTTVSSIWRTATVPKESIPLQDELQSFELQGLEESTSYEIRLYAENKFNKSLPTHTAQISTKGKHRDVECNTVTVAVGLSILTVIILVVNGILLYIIWAGKQKSKQTAQYLDSTDKQSNPEVYYNITDNQDDKTDLETSNYETLGTKDKPNLYDDLGKMERDTKSKLYSNTMI